MSAPAVPENVAVDARLERLAEPGADWLPVIVEHGEGPLAAQSIDTVLSLLAMAVGRGTDTWAGATYRVTITVAAVS